MLHFPNGKPGAISRSVDDIVISMRNASGADLPFGVPVFQVAGERSCRPYTGDASQANFLGFSVRSASKTPDTFGSSTAHFAANEPVDILVRGSIVLEFASTASPGSPVYLRKADSKLVTTPGAEGTTIQLPNVTVRTTRDTNRCAEVVIAKRNLL